MAQEDKQSTTQEVLVGLEGHTTYCLGWGTGTKCDECGQYKRWGLLNQLPDALRLNLQKEMTSVVNDLCVLNGRKHFQ